MTTMRMKKANTTMRKKRKVRRKNLLRKMANKKSPSSKDLLARHNLQHLMQAQ